MTEFKKILFPCDLSPATSKVLEYVLSIAQKYDSKVYLLHAVQNLKEMGDLYLPRYSVEMDQQKLLEAAEKSIKTFCEKELQACPHFEKHIVVGDPSTQILKLIQAEDIDLVVMGTHGRKGLEETIFGSVAENVVKKAPVPVLTINPYSTQK
jgi:nucleotide-binding universal stress UspA family protein